MLFSKGFLFRKVKEVPETREAKDMGKLATCRGNVLSNRFRLSTEVVATYSSGEATFRERTSDTGREERLFPVAFNATKQNTQRRQVMKRFMDTNVSINCMKVKYLDTFFRYRVSGGDN